MALPYPFGHAPGLDPHPRYAELRETAGLARVRTRWGGEAWLVTRHREIREVLSDPRFSRRRAAGREDVARARPTPDSPDQILGMDPPDHTRLRRLVAKAFTARRVEQMRPRVRQIVTGLLDGLVSSGPPGDLAATVAWPLPMTVISEMLGVPEADRDGFRELTEATLAMGAGTSRDDMVRAREQLNGYLSGLIARRRAEPTADLLSDLVAARDGGDRLSEEELVRLGVTLLISGHETTANQIGNFVFVLLADERSAWARLVAAGRQRVPRAVEELLRYVPMAAAADFARIAVEDVEVGGQLVRAGDAVLVQLHSGNRDDTVFDRPDEIDLTREDNPHLAFGHGVHHCLGAPLARMELQVALEALVTGLPGLRLAVPAEEVPWRVDRLVRGVRALPVTW